MGVVQHASDEFRLSTVRRRRDVERWWRGGRIQRDRDEFDRIDGLVFDFDRIDIDRFDINDDLKPDERIDDDGIDIKQYFVYRWSAFERDDGVFIGDSRIVERGFVVDFGIWRSEVRDVVSALWRDGFERSQSEQCFDAGDDRRAELGVRSHRQ